MNILSLLCGTLTISIVLNIALIVLARYLAIDPGFGIKTRAAGELAAWLAWGPRWVVYGDIDGLGLANDALTTTRQSGHDRFNEIARWVVSQLRGADIALVFGGDEWRFLVAPPRDGPARRWHAEQFCLLIQRLLEHAPYTDAEHERLFSATGKCYITITLASAYSRGVWWHRTALAAAKTRVQIAKPKDRRGQRGEILEALA
jgi:GGDEF domain-containing protein